MLKDVFIHRFQIINTMVSTPAFVRDSIALITGGNKVSIREIKVQLIKFHHACRGLDLRLHVN